MKNLSILVAAATSLLASFIFAQVVFAQEMQPFDRMDVFQLEWVSNPNISPDGKRVVYVRNGMDVMADMRTPLSESKQLYSALKIRGIDTALVEIPGAPHNIADRPSQLITKIDHILAWFAKYPIDDTTDD